MTDALQRIRQDHVNLAKLLDAVEKELDRFDRGERPDYDIIQGAVEYCLNYPDLFHHPLEDLIVRRLSERRPEAAPAVAGLEAEHKALAAATRRFADVVKDVLQEQEIKRAAFQDKAREFVSRYREHMRKEEETFLPAAAKALSAEDLADIAAQVQERGDPLFGPEQGKQFDALRKSILRWSKESQ